MIHHPHSIFKTSIRSWNSTAQLLQDLLPPWNEVQAASHGAMNSGPFYISNLVSFHWHPRSLYSIHTGFLLCLKTQVSVLMFHLLRWFSPVTFLFISQIPLKIGPFLRGVPDWHHIKCTHIPLNLALFSQVLLSEITFLLSFLVLCFHPHLKVNFIRIET